MAKYVVHMTFETPGLREPLRVTRRLPGRMSSMRCLGGDGVLAVSATDVTAESAADAAMIVVQTVSRTWTKSQGPLKMVAWQASRKRALFGSRNGSGWGTGWPNDDDGGSAGVREPRRPLPGPGSLYAARDLPDH